jgi:hypothetical protein
MPRNNTNRGENMVEIHVREVLLKILNYAEK